jgi:glycine/D-amino acid oxidase-like deaminating enzyme
MERTEKPMTRRIVVIGGGVVGSAVAAELTRDDRVSVTVVERGPGDRLVGSTRHAPGVVGLLGQAPVLTGLARLSAQVYQGLAQRGTLGFDRVGGLEVATSPAAARELERRAALAADAGLPARLLEPAQAARLAPDLVDPASCRAGLLFPGRRDRPRPGDHRRPARAGPPRRRPLCLRPRRDRHRDRKRCGVVGSDRRGGAGGG